MNSTTSQSLSFFMGCVIVSVSVTGYFVGLQSPMKQVSRQTMQSIPKLSERATEGSTIPATSYAEIGNAIRGLHARTDSTASIDRIVRPPVSEVISAEDKVVALVERQQNRAYNGAPPTIPHRVDEMASQTCMACHGYGMHTETLRISKMPHAYYANCLQCHVEQQPAHMQPVLFRQNEFAGLPAPNEGPRAYRGAPPQIPHSTWMRNDCLSCHGFTGSRGIQTTHPWRQNCSQCHTSSAESDQLPVKEADFLTPPIVQE